MRSNYYWEDPLFKMATLSAWKTDMLLVVVGSQQKIVLWPEKNVFSTVIEPGSLLRSRKSNLKWAEKYLHGNNDV